MYRPYGTSYDFYLPIYSRHGGILNGTVPEGLYIGRIKSNTILQKSCRDEIYQALQNILQNIAGQQ